MAHDERRGGYGRRTSKDRRQNGSGMITSYANYSGPERRRNVDRRTNSDRRMSNP